MQYVKSQRNDSIFCHGKGGVIIDIRKMLINEKCRLVEIQRKLCDKNYNVPEGSLRIALRKGNPQYYYCKPGDSSGGKYISKKDIALAQELAQKSYDEKVLRYVTRAVIQIDKLLKVYSPNRVEELYLSEHKERQKLVVPVELTYQQNVERWLSNPYNGKGFANDVPIIMTNKGIRVRSKSEKIIADYFESINIAYKYECPIVLKPYGIVYPDFTFLSRKTGKEIYWEHEGMLDNPEYARSAVQKIALYERNGIFPGENLILTFETSNFLLDNMLLKSLTERYLL